ncbi:uncharacterized protein LOC144619154 isoform X3 [Crassostrea virginica]
MKENWERWTSHTELQEMFEYWGKLMKEDLIMEEIRCQYEYIRQLKDIREKKAGILKEKEKSRTDLSVQQQEKKAGILKEKEKSRTDLSVQQEEIITLKIRRQREKIERFLDSRERLLHRMTHETNVEFWKQMEDKMRKMAGEHKSSGQWCKLKLPEHGMKMIEVKQDHAPLLPRYKYHCLLLDQLRNGIPKDKDFSKWTFNDSPFTVVGNVNEKQRRDLFKNSLEDGLSRDVKIGFEEDILIIYFYTNSESMIKDIKELRLSLRPFNLKTVLIVVKNVEKEKHMREEIAKEFVLSRSTHIEFVVESYEEIIGRITVTLEQRISNFLKSIQEELNRSDQKTYETSKLLLAVNAFLRRLKQAECYPMSLREEDPNMPIAMTGHKDIDEILDSDNILYRGYNGDELKVVTTDEDVKRRLLFKKEGKGEFEITIKDKLEVEELSNPGVYLHGAKHVYREESVSEFKSDNTFATTGSIMAANGDSMVVVTARHAFNGREKDPIYVLIEEEVVRLGGQIQQAQNMKYLHDDIAVVKVENEIREKVDAKCERLLFHDSKIGTPAKIASHDLKIGDIVHKRGAKTHLTTGVVKDIKTGVIGRFPESSLIIYITGMDGTQLFADKGDSGSLVYQQSLSPTHDVLEVHAMVQGREPDQIQDIICFPFIQGCETLHRNIPDLAPIKFFD